MSGDGDPLDAVEIIRRIERHEPHLVARIVAEMRAERLEKAMNGETDHAE